MIFRGLILAWFGMILTWFWYDFGLIIKNYAKIKPKSCQNQATKNHGKNLGCCSLNQNCLSYVSWFYLCPDFDLILTRSWPDFAQIHFSLCLDFDLNILFVVLLLSWSWTNVFHVTWFDLNFLFTCPDHDLICFSCVLITTWFFLAMPWLWPDFFTLALITTWFFLPLPWLRPDFFLLS